MDELIDVKGIAALFNKSESWVNNRRSCDAYFPKRADTSKYPKHPGGQRYFFIKSEILSYWEFEQTRPLDALKRRVVIKNEEENKAEKFNRQAFTFLTQPFCRSA